MDFEAEKQPQLSRLDMAAATGLLRRKEARV